MCGVSVLLLQVCQKVKHKPGVRSMVPLLTTHSWLPHVRPLGVIESTLILGLEGRV